MYPAHKDEEDKVLDALSHPEGESYPGEFDCYREVLVRRGWDKKEIEEKYGSRGTTGPFHD